MTRTLVGATLALGLLVCSGQPPAMAGGALIETTAPLADRSEESVKAAVIAAIDKAVRGASAMGFAWFQLRDAQVSGNEVAIQILATDEDPGRWRRSTRARSRTSPDATDDGETSTEEPGPGAPSPRRHACTSEARRVRTGRARRRPRRAGGHGGFAAVRPPPSGPPARRSTRARRRARR